MKFKTVIFDLDDTIIPSSKIYMKALQACGLEMGADDYQKARAFVKESLRAGNPSARNRLLYFKKLLEMKAEFCPGAVLSLMNKYEASLVELVKEFCDQSRRLDCLGSLKKDRRFFILTNENLRTQLLKLNAIDPKLKVFDGLVCSEEVGVEKPDIEIFEALCDRFSIDVESALMVGDDVECDMAPAKKLGMATCLSQEFSGASAEAEFVDYSLPSLEALESVFG